MNGIIELKKDTNQQHSEKELAKIAALWVIVRKIVHKDQENLLQNIQIEILLLMML